MQTHTNTHTPFLWPHFLVNNSLQEQPQPLKKKKKKIIPVLFYIHFKGQVILHSTCGIFSALTMTRSQQSMPP